MTDAELNHALASLQGYHYAGEFRGRSMYHPPGLRTSVVPLPDYVTDWNLVIPLVVAHPAVLATFTTLVTSRVGDLQRQVCHKALVVLRARVVTDIEAVLADPGWREVPLPFTEGGSA